MNCTHSNASYNGDVIKAVEGIESIFDCQKHCQKLAECYFWEYKPQDPKCLLKRKTDTITDFPPLTDLANSGETMSGPRFCPSKYTLKFSDSIT